MASDKKKRKASKQVRNSAPPPGGVFRHPDGDRRRKGLKKAVKEAKQAKEMQQRIGLPPVPEA